MLSEVKRRCIPLRKIAMNQNQSPAFDCLCSYLHQRRHLITHWHALQEIGIKGLAKLFRLVHELGYLRILDGCLREKRCIKTAVLVSVFWRDSSQWQKLLSFSKFSTHLITSSYVLDFLFLYMVTINMRYFMVSRKSCWGKEQLSALKIYNNNK